MRSTVVRFVLSMVFLGLLIPVYGMIVFLLIENNPDNYFDDETGIYAAANWGVGAMLVLGWLGCWGPRVIWTRWRVMLSIITLPVSIGVALAFQAGHEFVNDYSDGESVALTFIVWAIAWLVSTVVIWTSTPAERVAQFAKRGRKRIGCPGCGYDLTGLRDLTCPECGKQFTIDQILSHVFERGDIVEAALTDWRRFVVRWTRRGLVMAVVMLAIMVMGCAILHVRAGNELERAQARWRETIAADEKRDVPVDVPDDDNAAVMWQRAATTSIKVDDALQLLRSPRLNDDTEPWEMDLERLRSDLNVWRSTIDMVREAARRPACDWRVMPARSVDEAVEIQLSCSAWWCQSLVQMMVARATLEAREGRPDDAAAWLLDAARASGQIGAMPDSDALNAQIALDNEVLDACHELFRDSPAPTRGIVDLLGKRDLRAQALAQMRARGNKMHEVMDRLRTGSRRFWPLSIAHTHEEATALNHMCDVYLAAKSPAASGGWSPLPALEVEWWHRALYNLSTDYEWLPENITDLHSHIAMARLAHDLRDMKQAGGAYPDVKTFKPPNDPLTGKPFSYERVDDGFAIWTGAQPLLSRSWSSGLSSSPRVWYWDCKELPKELQDKIDAAAPVYFGNFRR